jgi:SAM-dependent methyltransferase
VRGWWLGLVLACTPVALPPSAAPMAFPAGRFGPVPDDPPEAEPAAAEPGPKDMSAVPGAAPDPRAGETESIKPGINDPYRGVGAAKRWSKRFERDGREVHDRRAEIIKAMGVGRGMAVRAKIQHVRLVQATDRSSELPAASVDAIFMSDAYHHLEYPQHTLATLRAALRPGGTLWLIDFKLDANSDAWLKQHVRAGKDQVLRELAAAGFVLDQELGLLQENYFLKLKVAAGP